MISFRFLDEAYNAINQTPKTLAIRNLSAQVYLDKAIIGEIQSYYLNAFFIFTENLDVLGCYLNTLDAEDIQFYKDTGIYDEKEFDDYIENNFLSSFEYEDFLNDNNLEKIDEYLRKNKNVLYISDLLLYESYDLNAIIEELRHTLYMLFDYSKFVIMDSKENIIGF